MSRSRPSSHAVLGALLLAATATLPALAAADSADAPRNLPKLAAEVCAGCHGPKLEGAVGPSLLDDTWKYGGDDAQIATSIRLGHPQGGMPPFGGALAEKDIRGLVVYLRELAGKSKLRQTPPPLPNADTPTASRLHPYRIETVAAQLKVPWSLAFLPDGRSLVTEKRGTLSIIAGGAGGAGAGAGSSGGAPVTGGVTTTLVTGTPLVDTGGQGGLFDVVPHPDFARNGWIYLAFADPQKTAAGRDVAMTAVVRGRIRDNAWVDQEVVYRAPLETYRSAGGVHFGGRLAFDRAGFLFFSIGERGNPADAQNLALPNGKIHRLHDDGRVPTDNPFVAKSGALPSIWSYGHRNPQGLRFDPASGWLWAHEHGPRGGDELNRIQAGRNYGWPLATFGINYNGTAITDVTTRADIEPPVTYWTPSIAPCGLAIYTGERFPKWKANLFVSSLAAEELRRLKLKDGKVVEQEIIFKGLGRLRDVVQGPDGLLYVLMPDRVARLVPAATP
jgi:glucose/arabinose dehydrogenase